MPVLSSLNPTLWDIQKSFGPDQKLAPFVELLAQIGTDDIVRYLPFQKANKITVHQTNVGTSLPTTTTRDYNEGFDASVGKEAQLIWGMTKVPTRLEFDSDLPKDTGIEEAAYIARQTPRYAEALKQAFQQQFIYGNQSVSNGKEINGLAVMYNTLARVISCGGTASTTNTSIYYLQPGQYVYGIYPGLSATAGIEESPINHQLLPDTAGKMLRKTWKEWWWNFGLAIEDRRCVQRVANIGVAHLLAMDNTQALTAGTNILKKMIDAVIATPDDAPGIFLANRTVVGALMKMAQDKSNSALSIMEATTQFGTKFNQLTYMMKPIVVCDRITNTEAQITA
jgi:hypothetical protein